MKNSIHKEVFHKEQGLNTEYLTEKL